MEIEVTGIDHMHISVRDIHASEAFYDAVMKLLGFRKAIRLIDRERHVSYFNRAVEYTLRPAHDGRYTDPYSVGSMHHLCFQVRDRAAVDEAHRRLREIAIEASVPSLYPDRRPDYYATYFKDPDGLRLEVVSDTAFRRVIRERWAELTDFDNPVASLLERDARALRLGGSPTPKVANLYQAPTPTTGEAFQLLARYAGTSIERIISSEAPGTDPYLQTQDEWVVLLRGAAELAIGEQTYRLRAGDYVSLPARTNHRVVSTSHGALWLAVHIAPTTH